MDGMTLFAPGTLHLDGILHSAVEEEEDEEEERERNLDLQKAILDLDETSQEHSALYSEDESHTWARDDTDEDPVPTEGGDRESTSRCEGDPSPTDRDLSPPVWSEKSDDDAPDHLAIAEAFVGSPKQLRRSFSLESHAREPISGHGQAYAYANEPYSDTPFHSNLEKASSATQSDFLSAETSDEQLRLLYEARGRELDRLTEELSQVRLASEKEIVSLKRQLASLKADKETLLTGETQAKLLLVEGEARIRSLVKDVAEKDARCDALEAENKKLKLALSTAEGTISSLEAQVAELQSVDCIAKSRRAHEEFLKKLQGSHNQEMEELKRKLKSATGRLEAMEGEVRSLEDSLATVRKSKDLALQEKAEVIRQLNASLDTAHQHIEALLRRRERKSVSPKKCDCNGLTHKELERYDMLAKLGLFKAVLPPTESSADQLKLGTVLTFDESSGPQPSLAESGLEAGHDGAQESSLNDKLKREIFQSLVTNKMYRERIQQLTESLSAKEKTINLLQGERKALEKASTPSKDSFSTPKILLLTEENSHLKRELALLIEDFEAVRVRGDAMVEAFREEASSRANKRSSRVRTSSADHAKLQAIEQYTKAVEKCGQVCAQTWEELRRENLDLHSKRFSVIGSLKDVVSRLKELQSEVKLKDTSGSSDVVALKQLLETFILKAKEVREQVSTLIQDNATLKNDLWTLKLNLQKAKTENTTLKTTTEALQKRVNQSDRDKVQTVETCKEAYLRFHEEAISKLREDLHNEYSILVSSLKEELGKISAKLVEAQNNYLQVCREKNNLEEMHRNSGVGKEGGDKEDASTANHNKEIDNLRKALDHFKTKSVELERELLELKNRENERNSSSIADNMALMEAKRQAAILGEEVKRLNAENEEREREYVAEKNALVEQMEKIRTEADTEKKDSGEISVSDVLDTIDKYKKLNTELKEENDKLKTFYEKQIRDLKMNMECHTNDVIEQTRKILKDEFEGDMRLVKEKVERLSAMVSHLEREKIKLLDSQGQEMRKLTNELQNRESKIEEIKETYEIIINNLSTNIHEVNVEAATYKDELRSLRRTLDQHQEKYSHLKKKFFKIKKNFDNYRTWADERAEKLSSEATSRLQEKSDKWDEEVNGFKRWLSRCREGLSESLSRVIEDLESVPERAVPRASLEPHLKALLAIHEQISNLDIRTKNHHPNQDSDSSRQIDEPDGPKTS